jgi:GYF domain 2
MLRKHSVEGVFMLAVSCPQCSCAMKAPEELIGKKAQCGSCGHVFVVHSDSIVVNESNPAGGPPPLPQRAWYYADAGEPNGPLTRAEMSSLIVGGTIAAETFVWQLGMAEWQPARQTELRSEFSSAAPPPLVGGAVPNGLAWAVALVPLANVFALGALPWWAFYAANVVLTFFDEARLKKAGHTAPFTAWAFVVPVYLFVRASKTRQRPEYAYVWIVCFLLSFLVSTRI